MDSATLLPSAERKIAQARTEALVKRYLLLKIHENDAMRPTPQQIEAEIKGRTIEDLTQDLLDNMELVEQVDAAEATKTVRKGIVAHLASNSSLNPKKDDTITQSLIAKYVDQDKSMFDEAVNEEESRLMEASLKIQKVVRGNRVRKGGIVDLLRAEAANNPAKQEESKNASNSQLIKALKAGDLEGEDKDKGILEHAQLLQRREKAALLISKSVKRMLVLNSVIPDELSEPAKDRLAKLDPDKKGLTVKEYLDLAREERVREKQEKEAAAKLADAAAKKAKLDRLNEEYSEESKPGITGKVVALQSATRRLLVRRQEEALRLAKLEEDAKKRPLTKEEIATINARLNAVVTIQARVRGKQARDRYQVELDGYRKLLKDDETRYPDPTPPGTPDPKDAAGKKGDGKYTKEMAAIIIQRKWRKHFEEKAKKFPENDPDISKFVDQLAAKRKKDIESGVWPRYLDRLQLAQELDKSKRAPDLFYDELTHTFKPSADKKQLQGQLIKGIYGHCEEFEQLDANGKPLNKRHLGFDRSLIHAKDRIVLDHNGFPIAEYDKLIDLQRDIDAVRRSHEAARLPGAPKLLKPGEVRTSFARYIDKKIERVKNDKGEIVDQIVGEEYRYAMLIQTQDGLTEVFVKDEVVTGRINRDYASLLNEALAKRADKDDANNYIADPDKRQEAAAKEAGQQWADNERQYKTLMAAALVACQNIVDPAAKVEAAEKMVRQEMRHQMMTKVTKEVEEARRQTVASHHLDEKDLKKLSDVVYPAKFGNKVARGAAHAATLGTLAIVRAVRGGPEEQYRKKVSATLKGIPDAVSNYIDHGGVAISKNRKGAKVTFNGGDPHDEMWINLPDTSYYVKASCAPTAGLYRHYVNGSYAGMVHRKAGETWVAENTVFFHNGVDYEPKRVIDSLIPSSNSLKNHAWARSHTGPDSHEGVQKMYKNFALQITANIGDVRAVTVKVGGYKAVSAILDPVSYKDIDNNQVKFTKKFPSKAVVSTMNIKDVSKSQWQEKEVYAKCPAIDLGREKAKQNPKAKHTAEENAADAAAIAVEAKFGQLFIKVNRGAAPKGAVPIEGDYYKETKPYKYDKATGQYIEVTRADIVAELTAQKVDKKYVELFADRFFERFADVKIKGHKVDDQFKQREEDLRAFVVDDAVEAKKVIKEYADRKVEIEARIVAEGGDITTAEKEAFYRNASFDINAVGENGQTALHLAAAKGREDVVAELLKAGANPNLLDSEGKTAAQLARKNGHFDAKVKGNWVEKLESAGELFKIAQRDSEMQEITRNAVVLRARAAKLQQDMDSLRQKIDETILPAAAQARADLAAAVAGNAQPAIDDANKKSEAALAKSEAERAKLTALEAAHKAAEKTALEAEAKLSKPKEVKIDPKRVMPDPKDNYEVRDHRIDLKNGKYIEIRAYYAKKDCVIPMLDNGEVKNTPVLAGSKTFDKNTAHFFYSPETGGMASSKMGTNIFFTTLTPPRPDGWKETEQSEWKKAVEVYQTFDRDAGTYKLNKDDVPQPIGDDPAWLATVKKTAAPVAHRSVAAAPTGFTFPVASTDPIVVAPAKDPDADSAIVDPSFAVEHPVGEALSGVKHKKKVSFAAEIEEKRMLSADPAKSMSL